MTKLETTRPCNVHVTHEPYSHVNEFHHVFPQWLQALSPVTVPLSLAKHVEVVCSTGHSNVHAALNEYISTGKWPEWLRAGQKQLVAAAIYYCDMYQVDMAQARKHLHGGE